MTLIRYILPNTPKYSKRRSSRGQVIFILKGEGCLRIKSDGASASYQFCEVLMLPPKHGQPFDKSRHFGP